uniref:NADH-ubiquinone oxidoreductase chain 6 n=1 Tax=Longitarsus nigrofasciatus TaxID=1425583 RepID=A0A1P8NMY4_9CUCU|nr:NADH dehydrogenase subunit 6 [Longitarsus nigrofasciatus]
MIMTLMILNTIMMLMFKHPLSCGMILLIQTILTALFTGLISLNFWYSYILFLIMIGGLLILFIYMTSIASNEKFKMNKMYLYMYMLFMLMMSMMFFIDPYYTNLYMNIIDMKNSLLMLKNQYSMMKYFNYPNYFIMIMMILYLFITLIAIVKITKFNYGPLRQKF